MACPPAAAGVPSPLQTATAQRESGPVQRAGATMKLQSSEGQIFEADLQTVMFSGTLRTMMEGLSRACPAAAEADDEVVPLVTVSAAVLQKVLQWLTYHKHELRLIAEEEAAGVPASRHLLASPWDTHFFSVDQDTLFQIIKAADYLDIGALMDAGCKAVANMMRGKTPDEIRRKLCMRNDFTPAQEEHAKREAEWYK
ncbi:S-phase kinase-associated protein 1-like isoform X2 [Haemaphysalis longicornis]